LKIPFIGVSRDSRHACSRAFHDGWRNTPGVLRAGLMHKLAALIEANTDRLSTIESTDNGKIVRETRPQMLWELVRTAMEIAAIATPCSVSRSVNHASLSGESSPS
jgi:acyl-CoA reductase-like NAD-dependent aldehyde dehydrogenase